MHDTPTSGSSQGTESQPYGANKYGGSDDTTPLLNPNVSGSKSKVGFFNVCQIGISFCFLFIAFNTVQSFEANVNAKLGLYSLSALYFCFSFGSLISFVVVQKLGEKISLTIGGFTYVAYVAANLYPRNYTLIPTGAILGFGASILWTAQGSYIAKNSDTSTLGYHSGVFFGFFMLNAVFGNIMAALLLHFHENVHFIFWVLFGISVVATLSFLLLRNPPVKVVEQDKSKKVNVMDVLKFFTEGKMLLMAVVLVYSGFSQSYFYSKIPQLMDQKIIGYVMAAFGASDTLSSVVMGKLSDKIGKKPVMILATICGLAAYVLSWFVSMKRSYLFYVIMVLLGISDGGYNTQLYSVLGMFQPEKIEAAYAFLKGIQATTTAIAFFYTSYLNLHEIIILVGSSQVLAIIAFLVCDLFVAKVDSPKEPSSSINN